MNHIGTTDDGQALFGREENGVRCYYLENKLVATASGNLEETSFTRYACLPGIWQADRQTSIVDETTLLKIAGKPVNSAV